MDLLLDEYVPVSNGVSIRSRARHIPSACMWQHVSRWPVEGLQTRQMFIGFSQLLQAYVKDQWATAVCSVLCWISGDAKELVAPNRRNKDIIGLAGVLFFFLFCLVRFASQHVKR